MTYLSQIRFAAALASLTLAGAAQAVLVNPNNASGDTYTNPGASNQGQAVGASGWYYNNVRNSGEVGIDGTYARSGNGSARMETTLGPGGASSKADIEYLAGGTNVGGNYFATSTLGLFSDFTVMQYDWLRDSSSTTSGVQHPAMRILLDLDGNLATTGDRGGLVYERAYNIGGSAPLDVWTTETVGSSSKVWNFGLGLGSEFNIDGTGSAYDDSLAEWQASGRMANAVILGFSVGVGSGWGPFVGAVDNIGWTIGGVAMSTNFELAAATVPLPATGWLLLAGVLGAAGVSTRRRKA